MKSAGAITVAANIKSDPQPTLAVRISHKNLCQPIQIIAVADTGAQVCTASVQVMKQLGLTPTKLHRCSALRDVANRVIQPLGSFMCDITVGNNTVRHDIYFLESAKSCYLSLKTCKQLGLVHKDFPAPLPTTASVVSAPTPSVKTHSGAAEVRLHSGLPKKPTDMPFAPLEENIERIQEWLLQHFSNTTFNTEKIPFPVMEGAPHHIHLVPDAKPYACHVPANVPMHWEAEVREQIAEDVKNGILRPVPQGEPTEWCARMVVAGKKDGHPRRTVDFQKLNASCLRETHHTPTPFDLVSGIPQHSYKTTADAKCGFHQVKLDEESVRLTTFLTPWGRYQYLRTPMGHCSSSDAYTRRFDDIIEHIPRKMKCVDDVLLHDNSIESSFWHTYNFLETCSQKGITLKPEKFNFCKREVGFVGFHIGWDAYRPTEERLSAIRNFSMPSKPSLTDIRSFFGFVNQLAPFLATAPIMAPFRDLLKKPSGKTCYWDEQLEAKFKQAKEVICQLAKDGLSYFDCSRPTLAMTDWSKEGIGFVILQQYCSCSSSDAPFCCKNGWRLALCGSRHLSSAEAGYAPVEGEALAVAWCLRKARLFLLGCPNLVLVTDHRPLVKLFGDRELKDILNPRLLTLKEKTLLYRFQIRYLPGKKNVADFLSRYPALRTSPDSTDEDLAEEIEVAFVAAVEAIIHEDCITLDEADIQKAASDDPVYQMLIAKVLAGDWHSQRSQEVRCLKQFYNIRERLSMSGGLVTYSFDQGATRLVIPEALRHRVASNLHAGHQGIDSMLRRARQTVYWPGMEGDLQYHRSLCEACNAHSPSQPAEPLALTPAAEYPFQQTAADLFQVNGQTYLAYADRLTGWLEIAHFPQEATSGKLSIQFRKYFERWGAPEEISSDGGTNLVSEEMRTFFKHWGVKMRISSAYYPQSNGRAEAAVKTSKRLLMMNTGAGGSLDTDKFATALLQYLNTPLRDINKSPAQLAMGRQLRDGVPAARQHYRVDIHWRKALRDRELTLAKAHRSIMVRDGAHRNLTTLHPGTKVRVQNQVNREWDRSGTVIEALEHRQYTIRLDGTGRLSRRNRVHLKPICNPSPNTPLANTDGSPAPGTSTPVDLPSVDNPTRRSSRISKKPDYYCGN